MCKVELSDVFRGDYLETVTAHISRIQEILDEYDVAIFMARKAICFYEALKNNGEVTSSNCRVVSGRIVYYNSLKTYIDKRIAVIDDVVVRGNSINRVATTLKDFGIKADYYVAACELRFQTEFENTYNISIEAHTTYSLNEIYHFSGLITQYIEASMITFNVDSPIYDVSNPAEDIDSILDSCGAVHLTSGLQEKYGIESRSLYFKYVCTSEPKSKIDEIMCNSIVKIRFYINDKRTIVVPFVLLPACEQELLEEVYKLIKTPDLDDLISCVYLRRTEENKYKLISYFLSDALFCHFASHFNLDYKRDVLNDILQFDKNLDDINSDRLKTILSDLMSHITYYNFSFSQIVFTECISDAYQFIAERDLCKQKYEDASGRTFDASLNPEEGKLSGIAFSFLDIYEWIECRNNDNADCFLYASSVIDVFVDMGLIVPAILHTPNGQILRAYKMGEYSKLTRDQVNAFINMLRTYQDIVERDLKKIEVEKLCVLFFKTLTKSGVFAEKVRFEEGAYSIAYSFYGPRVSTSKERYSVSKASAFITDFVDNNALKELTNGYRVIVRRPIDDASLDLTCVSFAKVYSKLNQVFVEHPYIKRCKDEEKSNAEHWNQYVHTNNQFLTLLAIGNNPKDQILSLCAEIKMATKIDSDMFLASTDKLNMYSYKLFLSGINSGIWKYWCFKGQALEKTIKIIGQYDYSVELVASQTLGPYDHNDAISSFLDECGEYLYSAAYVINELLKHTNRLLDFRFDGIEGSDYEELSDSTAELASNATTRVTTEKTSITSKETDLETIFGMGSFYYLKMKTVRKELREIINAKFDKYDPEKVVKGYLAALHMTGMYLLDKCDLYLVTKSAKSSLIEEYLVVHSNGSNLPDSYGLIRPCYLDGITEEKSTVVFPIENSEELSDVVKSVMEVTLNVSDCNYLLVRQKKKRFGFIKIGRKAKGTPIIEDLSKLISAISSMSNTMKSIYVYQNETAKTDILADVGVRFITKIDYDNRGKLFKYVILSEGAFGSMNEKGDTNFVFGDGSTFTDCDFVSGNKDCYNNNTNNNIVINHNDRKMFMEYIKTVSSVASKDTSLSDEQKEEVKKIVKTITDETNKEKTQSSVIRNALNALRVIKGSVEFAAAVGTIVGFFQNLGVC